MALKTALAVVGAGAFVALQGCGGGSTTTSAPGSSTSPAPSPSPGSATTSQAPSPGPATLGTTTRMATTSVPPQPSVPLTGAAAAAMMNTEYKAFDKDDPTGSIGTFIRITGQAKVYCHDGCHSGWTDCRVSGSVYNPTQIVNSTSHGINWGFTGTRTDGDFLGFWVNQTLIKQSLGKCAYVYDGGTDNKYNMGCGQHATCQTNSCDDKECAYASRDPATHYSTYVNGDSDAVTGIVSPACTDIGLCAKRGPSFYKETGYVPDETFDAWKWRAENGASDLWNEFVLDGELMKRELARDAAGTIPAIVYASSFPGDGRAAAMAMAQAFADDWHMSEPVPVIKIDLSVDVTNGGSPFVFEDASAELFV